MVKNIQLAGSSRLVNVINLKNSSHPEDIEVTLLSVCVNVFVASFNVALNPARVSTVIKVNKMIKVYKSISDSLEYCEIIKCIEFIIILNCLIFILKLWMGSVYLLCHRTMTLLLLDKLYLTEIKTNKKCCTTHMPPDLDL